VPGSYVKFKSNESIWGAMVTKRMLWDSNTAFHWDESLANVPGDPKIFPPGAPLYVPKMIREVR
jgi:hypothetical protein